MFRTITLTAAPQRNYRQLAHGPNEEHPFELSLDEERIKPDKSGYEVMGGKEGKKEGKYSWQGL